MSTLRFLFAAALKFSWEINSFDITGAFVHSPIEETVFVEPPQRFFPEYQGKVLKLKKALYGTKQAGRCWWRYFKSLLESWGFECDEIEECLYKYQKGNVIIVVWIHVDDGVVFTNTPSELPQLRARMEEKLRIKWAGKPRKIVGINVEYKENSTKFSQAFLIDQIVEKFKEEIGDEILRASNPLPQVDLTTSEDNPINATQYQSFIGLLNYLALGTRPDISYAVNYLARFSSCPNLSHWLAIKHLIRYIHSTKEKCLVFNIKDTGGLEAWSDAGWGGEYQHSTSGFIMLYYGCPFAWASQQQKTVAKSTAAAEYIALGNAGDFLSFIIPIIKSLEPQAKLKLMCDNKVAILVSEDNASKSKIKTVERNFFSVNDLIRRHAIELKWTPTSNNMADILTKALLPGKHLELVKLLFENDIEHGARAKSKFNPVVHL